MIAQVVVIFLWTAGSFAMMRHYRVFSPGGLANLPPRTGRVNLVHVGVALFVYIFAASLLFAAAGRVLHSPPTKLPLNWMLGIDGVARIITTAFMWSALRRLRGAGEGLVISWARLPAGACAGILSFFLIAPSLLISEVVVGQIGNAIRHHPPPPHPLLEALGNHPSGREIFYIVVTACVLAPVAEETFFRGFLQTAIVNVIAALRPPMPRKSMEPAAAEEGLWYWSAKPPREPSPTPPRDRWFAILVTSVIFALVHLDLTTRNFEVFLPIFLLSVALGYLYERTGNLWCNITLHATFNATSTCLYLLGKG